MKKSFVYILFFLSTKFYAQNDTLTIYYDIGKYKLSKTHKIAIDNQLKRIDSTSKYHVEIISSCDVLGSNKNNLILSAKRAENVRDLILQKEKFIISSIKHKGIGEIKPNYKSKNGIKNDRKTLLIFKDETQFVLDKIAVSEKGEIFILKNIVFDPGRHLLKKKSLPILKKLLQVLQDNPKLKIEISGHICCGKSPLDSLDGLDRDTKTYNLSETRAKHIYKYLVLKKIDSTRLVYKGYGFSNPLTFPEITPEDKSNNRRVEIKVIQN